MLRAPGDAAVSVVNNSPYYLRVEGIEQKAPVVAIGGDDQNRSADAFADHQLTQRPSRRRGRAFAIAPGDMRSTRASISSGNASLRARNTILR